MKFLMEKLNNLIIRLQKSDTLMMSGSNPRPEFMAKLKSFCKNLEGEVKHLDGEVKAALLKDKVKLEIFPFP